METSTEQLKQILGELFTLLENLESSNIAVLQLLKEKGIADEKRYERVLEEAGNASSVKWRAARLRMEYLLTPIKTEKLVEEKKSPNAQPQNASQSPDQKTAEREEKKTAEEKRFNTGKGGGGEERSNPEDNSERGEASGNDSKDRKNQTAKKRGIGGGGGS